MRSTNYLLFILFVCLFNFLIFYHFLSYFKTYLLYLKTFFLTFFTIFPICLYVPFLLPSFPYVAWSDETSIEYISGQALAERLIACMRQRISSNSDSTDLLIGTSSSSSSCSGSSSRSSRRRSTSTSTSTTTTTTSIFVTLLWYTFVCAFDYSFINCISICASTYLYLWIFGSLLLVLFISSRIILLFEYINYIYYIYSN
jgi:hypothetical protein